MKRGRPLQRKTPLRAKTPLKSKTRLETRTPLRRQSPKAKARQEAWNKITRAKLENGERCVDAGLSRCSGPIDGDHVELKSRGGKWDESNHALRCRKHHDRKHGVPWADETA